jgi:hypothetical protein
VEALYHGLHSAGKLEPSFSFHTEILDRYLEMKAAEREGGSDSQDVRRGATAEEARSRDAENTSSQASTGGQEQDEEGESTGPGTAEREAGARDESREESREEEEAYQHRRRHLQELRDQIQALHRASRTLSRQVPFADLIRFYTRDPWLRIKPYLPQLKLREFYKSYLMIRVLSELDRTFPDIRRGVIERMTRELFDGTPPPMTYFRPGIQLTPEAGGLPGFAHMRSVEATYNFLRFVYRGRMQEMVRTLSRILPVRQRDSSSDLVVHVSGVEGAIADLEDFDESFSPDSEDGKGYYRIRYAVENDATLQRSYRNIVQQRDRQAAQLVDAATEHIQGLATVFESISRTLTDQLRERYAAADHRVNSLDGLDRLLEEHGEKLEKFVRLIRQVRAMEEGY